MSGQLPRGVDPRQLRNMMSSAVAHQVPQQERMLTIRERVSRQLEEAQANVEKLTRALALIDSNPVIDECIALLENRPNKE